MSVIILFFLNLTVSNPYAQSIFKGITVNISPSIIIMEEYTTLDLHENNHKFLLQKSFDYKNDATFILPLTDENSKVFHVLYQTDFSGKLIYLAVSNNLLKWFVCEEKPMFSFDLCIKKMDCTFFPEKCIDEVIECVMQRLRACYESR
jgi:hypothetical protein